MESLISMFELSKPSERSIEKIMDDICMSNEYYRHIPEWKPNNNHRKYFKDQRMLKLNNNSKLLIYLLNKVEEFCEIGIIEDDFNTWVFELSLYLRNDWLALALIANDFTRFPESIEGTWAQPSAQVEDNKAREFVFMDGIVNYCKTAKDHIIPQFYKLHGINLEHAEIIIAVYILKTQPLIAKTL